MHLDDLAADTAGLRVPGHLIADSESFRHDPLELDLRMKRFKIRCCHAA